MPRLPVISRLPPLETALRSFRPRDDRSKHSQIVDALRALCSKHRKVKSEIFYSTRELSAFFQVAQRTILTAIKQLEGEGLLQRIRGSHTKLVGSKFISGNSIQAVAGFPYWMFGMRHAQTTRVLPLFLEDCFWQYRIALHPIIFFEGDEKHTPAFFDRIIRREFDFCIWFLPFPTQRDLIRRLQDRGVRNFVINDSDLSSDIPTDMRLNYQPGYEATLKYWREKYNLKHIHICRSKTNSRMRHQKFAQLAQAHGFTCDILEISDDLITHIHQNEKNSTGIALLDEQSTVEFTQHFPSIFLELIHKHRFFFGEDVIQAPFISDYEGMIERTFVEAWDTAKVIVERLELWRLSGVRPRPIEIKAKWNLEWPLTRFD